MTEETREDQQFIEYVVRAIVDNPDGVRTERIIDERGVLITLFVDPSDMGKVIGKEGRTAKAIRSLLKVLGAKNQARVTMKIVEPEGGRQYEPNTSEETSTTEAVVEEEVVEEEEIASEGPIDLGGDEDL